VRDKVRRTKKPQSKVVEGSEAGDRLKNKPAVKRDRMKRDASRVTDRECSIGEVAARNNRPGTTPLVDKTSLFSKVTKGKQMEAAAEASKAMTTCKRR